MPSSPRSAVATRLAPILLVLSLLLVAPTGGAWAAPGDLDTTWGGDGFAIGDIEGFTLGDAAAQADGRVVVGGAVSGEATVVRLDATGTRDLSFGAGGTAVVPRADAQVTSVAVTGGDSIVVAGVASSTLFVARFTPAGALDTTFGTGGVATLGAATLTNYQSTGLVVRDDGSIVVASLTTGTVQVKVQQLQPSGSLDATFGTDGSTLVAELTWDLVLDSFSDGSIIVGGVEGGVNERLVKLTADGAYDPAFGAGGVATYQSPDGGRIFSASVDPTDRVLVAGAGYLARFTSTGSVDTTFSTDGSTTVPGLESIFGLFVAGDGRIVASGSANSPASLPWVLALRFTDDGTLDTSFGTGGAVNLYPDTTTNSGWFPRVLGLGGDLLVVGWDANHGLLSTRMGSSGAPTTSWGADGVATLVDDGSFPAPEAVEVDASGRTILAGQHGGDAVIARFDASGTLDGTFAAAGSLRISTAGAWIQVLDVAVQQDGRILAAGGDSGDGWIRRYLADGSPDASFGTAGLVVVDAGSGGDAVRSLELAGGAVLFGGSTTTGGFIGRLGADGALDSAFATDGRAELAHQVADIALRSGGGVVGSTLDSTEQVVALTASGDTDATFGGDGAAQVPGLFNGWHVEVMPDGRIVVAGDTTDPGPFLDVDVARLLPDGTADPDFAPRSARASSGGEGTAGAMRLLPDGSILLGTYHYESGAAQLAHVLANGTMNAAFGGDGAVALPAWNTVGVLDLDIDADGWIVAAASTGTFYGHSGFSAIRVEGPAIDAMAPSPPVLASTSHTVGGASRARTINASLTGASDGAGTGIAGYAVEWSTAPTTVPPATIDVVDTGDTQVTSPSLRDGATWYLHVRVVDGAGNWSATAHLGPFVIDGTAPDATTLTPSSHVPGTASRMRFVTVGLSSATDSGSGVAGWSVLWSSSSTATLDAPPDLAAPATEVESPQLADGTWYLLVRTVDAAGNASATTHAGPFVIDGTAPGAPVAVRDGSTGVDIDVTTDPRFHRATWTALPGITRYERCIRSSTVTCTSARWTSPITGTSLLRAASMRPDIIYVTCIRGVDAAGNRGPARCSDGVTAASVTLAARSSTGSSLVCGASPGLPCVVRRVSGITCTSWNVRAAPSARYGGGRMVLKASRRTSSGWTSPISVVRSLSASGFAAVRSCTTLMPAGHWRVQVAVPARGGAPHIASAYRYLVVR